MAWLLGFQTRCVPRYGSEDFTVRALENALRQRTLWTAVQDLLYEASDSAQVDRADEAPVWVEVRIACELVSRSILLGLHVHVAEDLTTSQADAVRRGVALFQRLLPDDYPWQVVDSPEDGMLAPLADGGAPLHVSKVERRISFIDLPWRSIETMDPSTALRPARDAVQDDARVVTEPRHLLTREVVRPEMAAERFCLPIAGAIEADPRTQRALFQEMQDLAPCVVSIAVAPVPGSRIDLYRRMGSFWSGYLDHFADRVANAGFGRDGALRALYDKFLLPDRQLFVSTTRVAARSEAASTAIAVHLMARLGGLRAFCVRPPRWHNARAGRQGAGEGEASATPAQILARLADPYVDVPSARWSAAKLAHRRDLVLRDLTANGIGADLEPAYIDFLLDAPFLYSFDEVVAATALPCADDHGLPGLETRLMPPFSVASEPPVSAQALRQRLRIGQGTSRMAKQAETQTPEAAWHSIDIDDLTKHAFVVGSTGSGKTVTTLFLVRELLRLGVPALVIEPVKTEYYDQVRALAVEGADIRRVRFEGTSAGEVAADFLAFDPLRLQRGVTVSRHASYLKSCFEAAFPMPPDSVEAMLLEAGLRDYYTTSREQFGCGLSMFTRGGPDVTWRALVIELEREVFTGEGAARTRSVLRSRRLSPYRPDAAAGERAVHYEEVVHPSLNGLRKFFSWHFLPRVVQSKGRGKLDELLETWRQFFERRFDALATGMVGQAAAKADAQFIADRTREGQFTDLLEGLTILELDGIPDDEQKALMIGFIMVFLFERRQADDLHRREQLASGAAPPRPSTPQRQLQHVLILEEAHRILPNVRRDSAGGQAQNRSVSMFVDMLAEIRAFGQGIVIVEQIPTKVVPEAVKNTNLKIMLRLTAADDREFLGDAMNFTAEQKRFVTSLQARAGRGVDMVVFEQQLDQPRLLTIPLPAQPENPIHASLFRFTRE